MSTKIRFRPKSYCKDEHNDIMVDGWKWQCFRCGIELQFDTVKKMAQIGDSIIKFFYPGKKTIDTSTKFSLWRVSAIQQYYYSR